jgi:hypothetical protein
MYPFCDGEVFFVDRSLLMGASFIEKAPFLRRDIRFVTSTQIEKGRHNM